MNNIEVHFSHPRDSTRNLTAEVSPVITGQQALQSLLADDGSGPFLATLPQGQTYELALRRTGQAIMPSMTFQQVGVVDGDWIEVRQGGQGATPAA